MKWYLLHHTNEGKLAEEVAICSNMTAGEEPLCWTAGRPMDITDVPVTYELDKDLPTQDYLYTTQSQFLISRSLYEFLRARKASSYMKGYEACLYWQGQLVRDDLVAVNFECSFSCLDRTRAEYTAVDVFGDKVIISMAHCVIEANRLPEDEEMIRLADCPTELLVSDNLKTCLERQGFAGMAFEEIEVA